MDRRKPSPSVTTARRGRPPGAFTQHRRFDRLRLLLEQHPKGLTIYEIASELRLTPRSVRRYMKEVGKQYDLERIDERPGGAPRWRVRAGELPRKIELRRTQAYALLAARKLFEPMRGSTLFDEIDMATQRLFAVAQRPGRGPNAGVADARLEDRFLYLPVAPKDYGSKTAELDELFQAVADLRPLKCRYTSAQRGAEEAIVIHPYALVLYKDAIYCVGFHVGRGEIRTFTLDRMRDTEASAVERFELPSDFHIEDWFQGEFGIWRGKEKTKVVVEFDAKVADLVRSRRVHATQKLSPLPDGGVRLTITIGDLKELTSWLLAWGRTARVVEPEVLAAAVRAELEGALEGYRASRRAPETLGGDPAVPAKRRAGVRRG